ncbi:MAG: threonine synthase [Acidimicrobiia bacterium]|nr:threonine synthase [Acidimicrobiia bacterium]
MRYVSTRGAAPPLGFSDVLLGGLAPDGGLYLPETWPPLPGSLGAAAGASTDPPTYQAVATEVMAPFVTPDIGREELAQLVTAAYATFDAPEVTPLTDLGEDLWLLELFHGPTLAFKDVALQLVGHLFERELSRRGDHITIVGATSGDTGSAAIEACRDREGIDIVILHPLGRTSEVQRRQMTTVTSANVHNVAIEGTFDDCQDLVKALFANDAFRTERNLSAVNSINWARVMAQIVYYVVAARRCRPDGSPVSFSVPTGNFGNVFAGWAAARMGVPVSQLVIGSNRNDVLPRWLATGRIRTGEVHATLSPSMDIAISSNHERLLFELSGRDGARVAELMAELRGEGEVTVPDEVMGPVRETWAAASFDDDATLAEIRRVYESSGQLVDPHTAVGLAAARACRTDPDVPMVALATAHPAKFPDAVAEATGLRPPLPERLADLFDRPEHYVVLPADETALVAHIDDVVAR